MGYVNKEDLFACRGRISDLTVRGDTFLGLLIYCINIKEWLIPLRQAKADMEGFSLLADKAFGLVEPDARYSKKDWHALFSESWLDKAKTAYLKGRKIPALDTCVTLFGGRNLTQLNMLFHFLRSSSQQIYTVLFLRRRK
ncbi:hypothetical protein O9853_12465 [Vibrio lentus]|nr:hypothetical protein [Vibrio lentus]